MVERFRRYEADMIGHRENIIQTFTNILNLRCDLNLACSNPIFPQDTPAYDASLPNQVWMQIDQQFRRYDRNSHILIISALAVTLTLKSYQIFRRTHRLMIVYHHTKCG